MKKQKRQKTFMTIMAGLMAVLMLLPILANIFVQ